VSLPESRNNLCRGNGCCDCRFLMNNIILYSLAAEFCINGDSDAATHCKFRAYLAPAGFKRRYQIIKNYIGYVFVKNTFIAERP
jgi:hypothetical protein